MLKRFILLVCISLSIIANPNVLASISDFDNAKKSLKDKEYRTAKIHLKNHLKKSPQDAKARFLLGDVYLYTGNLEASVKELGRAHELAPKNNKFLFRYAEGLLRSAKSQTLIDLLSDKTDDKSLAYIGYAQLGLNKLNIAQEFFNRSNKVTENALALNGLAKISLNRQQLPISLKLINRALAVDSKNTRTLSLKAKYFILNKQPNEALLVYNDLIKSNRNNVTAYIGRGAVHSLLNNTDNAIKDLKQAISISKMHPEANSLLSQILLRQNDFNGARANAQNVLDIIPNDPAALITLGTAQLQLNNLFQADIHLNKYLALYPNDVNTINMLARHHLRKNDPKKSISIIKRATPELINQSTLLLLTLSDSYLALGDTPNGIVALQKAKVLSPNNTHVKTSLFNALLKTGHAQEVINELESSLKAGTANTLDQQLLVTAYINQKNYKAAYHRLQQFIDRNPNDLAFRNLDALISQLNGDIDVAYQKFTAILKQDKSNTAAQSGVSQYFVEKARQLLGKKDYVGANALVKTIPPNNQNMKNVLQADIYRAQNQYSKALPLYQQAYQTNPNPVILRTLINTLIKLYKTKEAVKLLENVAKKSPKNISLQMMLAGLLQATHQTEKLKTTYQNILILRPYDINVLNNLSWMVYKKDLNKALSMAKLARQHAPNSAPINDTYGYFLTLQGKYKEGLMVLQQAARLAPSDSGTQYHIAIALDKLGKQSMAVDILKRITANNNSFPELRDASLLLKQIQ